MHPYTIQNHAIRWLPGFLECQAYLPPTRRIPSFVRDHRKGDRMEPFIQWMARWKPDVLLTADRHIPNWLDTLKLSVPRKIGFAGLGVMHCKHWAGVRSDHEMLGVRVVEQVAAKIERGEYGPAPHPGVLLIPGRWVKGKTLRRIGPPVPPPIIWEREASGNN